MKKLRVFETIKCAFCDTKFIKIRCDQRTCGSKECHKWLCKERDAKKLIRAKTEKLCGQCFKNPQTEGSLCSHCAEKSRTRQAERQEELRTFGICIQCGNTKAVTGFAMCQPCLDNFKKYAKKSREKNGLKRTTVICLVCWETKEHHAKGLCHSCYQKSRKNNLNTGQT